MSLDQRCDYIFSFTEIQMKAVMNTTLLYKSIWDSTFFFLMYCRYCEDWLMWKKLPSMYTTSFQRRCDVERYRTTSYRRWNDVMCVLGMAKIFQNSKDNHDLERKWKWRYWAIISHWFKCIFPELKRCRLSFCVIEIYLHSRRA